MTHINSRWLLCQYIIIIPMTRIRPNVDLINISPCKQSWLVTLWMNIDVWVPSVIVRLRIISKCLHVWFGRCSSLAIIRHSDLLHLISMFIWFMEEFSVINLIDYIFRRLFIGQSFILIWKHIIKIFFWYFILYLLYTKSDSIV